MPFHSAIRPERLAATIDVTPLPDDMHEIASRIRQAHERLRAAVAASGLVLQGEIRVTVKTEAVAYRPPALFPGPVEEFDALVQETPAGQDIPANPLGSDAGGAFDGHPVDAPKAAPDRDPLHCPVDGQVCRVPECGQTRLLGGPLNGGPGDRDSLRVIACVRVPPGQGWMVSDGALIRSSEEAP